MLVGVTSPGPSIEYPEPRPHRCIMGFNAGPPMTSGAYYGLYGILAGARRMERLGRELRP